MVKYLIGASAGLLVGAGLGYFIATKVLEKKYADICEREIDYWQDKLTKAYEDDELRDRVVVRPPTNKPPTPPTHNDIRHNPHATIARDEPTTYDNSQTEYFNMAKNYIQKKWNQDAQTAREAYEEDYEFDDGQDEDDDDISYDEDRTVSNVFNKPGPYVIDDIQYNEEFDHHDKVSLYYYLTDDTLCDENEELMDDIENTVGNAIFDILKRDMIGWVRNEKLAIDYEICAIRNSYKATVYGEDFDDDSALSPREKYYRKNRNREE